MSNTIARIPISRITLPAKLPRLLDPDWAAVLAESFTQQGQLTPIQVKTPNAAGQHELIAGLHRLEAARIAGWTEIAATIFEGSDLEARLAAIDENLVRRELSELDRAMFLAERKAVYLALHPATGHGGDRKSAANKQTSQVSEDAHLIGIGDTFAEATARKLGLHPATIRKLVARERIAEDVRARIATTAIADRGAELDALARLEPARQREVVEAMLRDEEPAPSVAAALREIEGEVAPEPTAIERQYQGLIAAWKKAGKKAREQFTNYLVAVGALKGGAP